MKISMYQCDVKDCQEKMEKTGAPLQIGVAYNRTDAEIADLRKMAEQHGQTFSEGEAREQSSVHRILDVCEKHYNEFKELYF